jgi:hypothetical protein
MTTIYHSDPFHCSTVPGYRSGTRGTVEHERRENYMDITGIVSRRDWYAGQALQAIICAASTAEGSYISEADAAESAWNYAVAMMAERSRRLAVDRGYD